MLPGRKQAVIWTVLEQCEDAEGDLEARLHLADAGRRVVVSMARFVVTASEAGTGERMKGLTTGSRKQKHT